MRFAAGLGVSAWRYELRLGGGKVLKREEMMFLRLQLQVQTDDRWLVKGWKGSWSVPLIESLDADRCCPCTQWTSNLVLNSKLLSYV